METLEQGLHLPKSKSKETGEKKAWGREVIYSEITVGGSIGDYQDSCTKGDNLKDLHNFPVT